MEMLRPLLANQSYRRPLYSLFLMVPSMLFEPIQLASPPPAGNDSAAEAWGDVGAIVDTNDGVGSNADCDRLTGVCDTMSGDDGRCILVASSAARRQRCKALFAGPGSPSHIAGALVRSRYSEAAVTVREENTGQG